MPKPTVKSTVRTASKFEAAVDVKAIGKGKRSLRDLFAPQTTSHTPIAAVCDVRSKDFGAVL